MSTIAQRIVALARRRNTLRSRCFAWQNVDAAHRSIIEAPEYDDYCRTATSLDVALNEAGKDDPETEYDSRGRIG